MLIVGFTVGFFQNKQVKTVELKQPTQTLEERYILKLSPKYGDAAELGTHIKSIADTFSVDSKVLVAIAFQESSFNTKAINKNDLGMFQLNYIHQIVRRGRPYEIQELTEDWRLNSILAAQYLRECMAIKPEKGLEPYTCFHSYTYEKRLVYQQHIRKHLKKLEGVK